MKPNPFDAAEVNRHETRIICLLDSITEWYYAEGIDLDFDFSFVEKMQETFDTQGTLSEKQIGALENILEKWVEK